MRPLVCLLALVVLAAPAVAQSVAVVAGADTVVVDRARLDALPERTARVRIHDGPEQTYTGPSLADVLGAAGVPLAGMRGADLARVAVVEARDGYRVAFGLAELAPDLGASRALLALRVDGAAISDADGPLRLIVEGDERAARWVRQVARVHVWTAGD